jgi:hypothetical protein
MSKLPAYTSELPAKFQSPASGVRGAIDSLVQSSLVQLFGAYNVAVAPLPRLPQHHPAPILDISASVGLSRRGAGAPGRLTLSAPSELLQGMSRGPSGGRALLGDWARELANQLAGRIKNRMLQFNVKLDVGTSHIVDSKVLASQLAISPSVRVYPGRTLRGEVLVSLTGMPEESALTYVGPAHVASEGAVILF